MWVVIRLTLLLFLPIVLSARVDIFGHIGSMCHSEDEGCGSHRGTSYGGGVIVPFFGNWTVEGDFQTSYDPRNRGPDEFWRDRKTFYLANFLRRWGNARAYAFAGAGVGLQDRETEWRHEVADEDYELDPRTQPHWFKVRDGVFGGYDRYWEFIWFAPRGGFTVYPHKHVPVGLRFEVYIVRKNGGARVSVTYRL
ncbi:MAG: hypothetical protein OXN97_19695 [Bryobacterales bacterium]|nr:hypothetical protein [Bryobacterales bacterium]